MRRVRSRALRAFFPCLWAPGALLALTGCSDSEANVTPDVGCASTGIVSGSETPRLFGLPSDRARAIVTLLVQPVDASERVGTCTGTVVAPGFVLSSAHCLDRDGDGIVDHGSAARPNATIEVRAGADEPESRYPVDAAWLHPELDVALLEAQALADAEEPIPSLPLHTLPLNDSWVGSPVEIAGVGVTETDEVGALRFAIEPIVRVLPQHVVVDGSGRTGACVGDSGGPALARSDDASVRVVGVLDAGDASCVGEDYYTRIDQLTDWEPLETSVLAQATSDEPTCDGVDAVGTCLRGHAFHCVAGVLSANDCAARGEVCGWSDAASGFRCVTAADDPCSGIGSFAACREDGRLTACREGALSSIDCGACGSSCVPWAGASGAACL